MQGHVILRIAPAAKRRKCTAKSALSALEGGAMTGESGARVRTLWHTHWLSLAATQSRC